MITAMALPLKSFSFGPGMMPATAKPSLSSLLGVHGYTLHVENGKSFVEGIGGVNVDPKALPFVNETFGMVVWATLPSNHHFTYTDVWHNWLNSGMRMVTPGGFLVFDDKMYIRWGKLLEAFGWNKLPFKFDSQSIFQKPTNKIMRTSA